MKSKVFICIILAVFIFEVTPLDSQPVYSFDNACQTGDSLLVGPSSIPFINPLMKPNNLTEEKCYGIPGVCKVCASYVIEKKSG